MLRIVITFCLLHAENLRFPWGASVSPRSFWRRGKYDNLGNCYDHDDRRHPNQGFACERNMSGCDVENETLNDQRPLSVRKEECVAKRSGPLLALPGR